MSGNDAPPSFRLDGEEVPFVPGQTLIQAAKVAGKYIPHLCWHPDFVTHGSCKLCTVKIGKRYGAACTIQAAEGLDVENRTPELDDKRRTMLQMLFVEGNHFCPSCEKSGNCALQATAYELGMLTPHFDHFFPLNFAADDPIPLVGTDDDKINNIPLDGFNLDDNLTFPSPLNFIGNNTSNAFDFNQGVEDTF